LKNNIKKNIDKINKKKIKNKNKLLNFFKKSSKIIKFIFFKIKIFLKKFIKNII
jgi:hypothetical protein